MIVYYTYISLYQGNIGKIENHKIFRKSFSSANNIYYEHILEEDIILYHETYHFHVQNIQVYLWV